MLATEGFSAELLFPGIWMHNLSYHAPVYVSWKVRAGQIQSRGWCLNNFLLEAVRLKEKVAQGIDNFFIWNKGSASIGKTCNAFKAYIPGILITFKAARDKQHGAATADLTNQIQWLEESNKCEAL